MKTTVACPECGAVVTPSESGDCEHCGGSLTGATEPITWHTAAKMLRLSHEWDNDGRYLTSEHTSPQQFGGYQVDISERETSGGQGGKKLTTKVAIGLPEDVPFTHLRHRSLVVMRAIRQRGKKDSPGPRPGGDWDKTFKVKTSDLDLFVLAGGRQLAEQLDDIYFDLPNWVIRGRRLTWSPWLDLKRLSGDRIVKIVSSTIEAVDQVRRDPPDPNLYGWNKDH